LELVRELLPRLSRVAAIYDRWGKGQVPLLEAPASQLGLRLQPIELAEPYNYEEAFRGAKAKGLEAVLVTFSPYFYVHRAKLVEAALAASMPTIFPEESAVRVGGLMSYGPDATATWKRAGYFIDRILKGEKASDLPMEQPQVFRLVINMKSAKALRIEVPQSLMVRADVLIG
jgi:putative ABC transport system substrate-binding protein